jgi:hypothetical protein
MRIKIESDGTPRNTHVYAIDEQGRSSRITRVETVDIHMSADGRAEAQIVITNPELDMSIEDAELTFKGRVR